MEPRLLRYWIGFNRAKGIGPIRQRMLMDYFGDIERACPGVGREWIRSLLSDLKADGKVACQGKGPGARWRYLGNKGINS